MFFVCGVLFGKVMFGYVRLIVAGFAAGKNQEFPLRLSWNHHLFFWVLQACYATHPTRMKNTRKKWKERERHPKSLPYIFYLEPFLRRNPAAPFRQVHPWKMNRWNPKSWRLWKIMFPCQRGDFQIPVGRFGPPPTQDVIITTSLTFFLGLGSIINLHKHLQL